MKKLFLVLALVLTFAATASAGKMGIGYMNSGTPLGMKLWLSDSFGLDFGAGFATGAGQNFALEVGVDMVMAKVDTTQFQLRGGMAMNFGAVTNLYWPLGINIEHYVAKNLSLNMGMGIQLSVQNTVFVASTFCNTTGGLGVIYYF